MVRRVVFNMTITLDGRITGPGGPRDMGWVVPHAFDDVARDRFNEAVHSSTTALMGSTNAEGFAAVWPPVADDESADSRDRAFARWLNETEKVVLSSTGRSSWPNARVLHGDTSEIVRGLRQEPGGDILVLNSVSIMNDLLRADLIDRIELTIAPEILGAGRVLFEEPLPASHWSVDSVDRGDSGVLAVRYHRVR